MCTLPASGRVARSAALRSGWVPIIGPAFWGVPVEDSSPRISVDVSLGRPWLARMLWITAAAPATMGDADEVPPNDRVYHCLLSPPFARSVRSAAPNGTPPYPKVDTPPPQAKTSTRLPLLVKQAGARLPPP